MNHNQPHEPETKGFNKTRDFQDRLARLIKDGVTTKSEAAQPLVDWFLDANDAQRAEFMEWAAGYWWSVVEGKMERFSDSSTHRPSAPSTKPILSPERRAKIEETVQSALKKQWLTIISNLTGAQVRAAKALPDHMAEQIGDDQRVGDVFTAEQLIQAKQA